MRVPLEQNLDLLRCPARACLGFAVADRPWIEPVAFVFHDGHYLVSLETGSRAPEDGTEVVLVVDEGRLFFELRAVYIRGKATHIRDESEDARVWVEVLPTNTTSWDYGRMRET